MKTWVLCKCGHELQISDTQLEERTAKCPKCKRLLGPENAELFDEVNEGTEGKDQ